MIDKIGKVKHYEAEFICIFKALYKIILQQPYLLQFRINEVLQLCEFLIGCYTDDKGN